MLTQTFRRACGFASLFRDGELSALELESLLVRDGWYNVTFGQVPTACYNGVEYPLRPLTQPAPARPSLSLILGDL